MANNLLISESSSSFSKADSSLDAARKVHEEGKSTNQTWVVRDRDAHRSCLAQRNCALRVPLKVQTKNQ